VSTRILIKINPGLRSDRINMTASLADVLRTLRLAFAGLLAGGIALLAAPALAQSSVYVIGNSLTNDMVPDGLQALASVSGTPADVGFHIRSSNSLTYIVANPADVTFTRGGAWPEALATGRWDAITMQPYFGVGSTLESEAAAILALVDQARRGNNAAAKFYVYAAWPSVIDTGGRYESYWRQAVADSATQPTVLAAAYFDALLARLRRDLPAGTSIDVIPVGEVLAQVDRKLRSGARPGIDDVTALYRDADHMGDVGRYAAATTVYMKVWGRRPVAGEALAVYRQGLGRIELSSELARWIDDVAWDTVQRKSAPVTAPQGGGGSPAPGLLLMLLGLAALARRRR
jgi:MYXO-CTERM domain-containing protein